MVQQAKHPGRQRPLGRHTTIGRAPESDLCLEDSSVSRRTPS